VNPAVALREQLKALENLQEIDLKIDALKKNKGGIPTALKALDDGLAKLRATTELRQKALAEVDKNQKQTQAAQDINRDRLARANSKLEGVQNSQEFQSANKEIDQLKKLSGTLEEQSKKATADIDALTKEIADMTAKYAELKTERDEQAAKLATQNSKLDGDISSLTAERQQFASKVEARTLSQYDRVRTARAGLGIVPAIGGRCKGCNMMVPPQLFNEIQRGTQMHQCPSCHRILFVPVAAAEGQAS
jgi:predicted  nucleic acid-binding Zn-ribbon protein